MNAIQNARPAAAPNTAAADASARNRQGNADAASNTFEQLLSPKPDATRNDKDATQGEAAPAEASPTASTSGLPQALVDLLRSAHAAETATSESDAQAPDAEDADRPDDAIVIPPQTFLSFPPRMPMAIGAPPAQTPPPPAAPLVSQNFAAANDDAGEGGAESVATPQLEPSASRPERSSIMSAVDDVLKTTRHAAAARDQTPSDGSNDGMPQQGQAAEIDGAGAPLATDDGVKVSFVSMSSTPARPAPVSETLATQRPQAATPPAPPPPALTPAHQLRLIMEPSGLGAVALNLHLANAQVSVDLEAQRSETRHALESHRDQLVDSLTGAGYDVAHVQVKTAAAESAFDPRREGAATNDAPSERARQDRDESARGDGDSESRKGDHAEDSRARAHRSGGVFI